MTSRARRRPPPPRPASRVRLQLAVAKGASEVLAVLSQAATRLAATLAAGAATTGAAGHRQSKPA